MRSVAGALKALPAQPALLETKSALDTFRADFPPVRYACEGLIPEGTALLAGKPKSGKSWLALGLLVAAAIGARLLGRPVAAADSLYLALEDNELRMNRRLKELMKAHPERISELARINFRCDWPPGSEGSAALDAYLKARPAVRLVVVDTLKMIRGQQDRRRDAYSLDYEAIQPWKAVADRHRLTLLIVHHTRKAEADDVFDEISGTLGLSGAVDQLMVLRRLPDHPKRATLHARGRDLEQDIELGIELEQGWWHVVGTAEEAATTGSRAQILEALRSAPRGMTAAELLKATGRSSRTSLHNLLTQMRNDGLVTKQGSVYSTPSLNEDSEYRETEKTAETEKT